MPYSANRRMPGRFFFLLLPFSLTALLVQPSLAGCAQTTIVSVGTGGVQAGDSSYEPSVSTGGAHVSFQTRAGNLAAGDNDGEYDVFVRDTAEGQTSWGSPAAGISRGSAMAGNGGFMAFESNAETLVPDDTNRMWDVFVYALGTGQVTRISVSSDGAQGNGDSGAPSISSDGRYVAFASGARNLVDEDTNGYTDIFVRDRTTGQTTLASLSSEGAQANYLCLNPSISGNGLVVAFQSRAGNLVASDTYSGDDIFVRDRVTGRTTLVSVDSNGSQGDRESRNASVSKDGRYVAFQSKAKLVPEDTDYFDDVYVHDRETGKTTCASVDSQGNHHAGDCYYPSISANGRYVAFSGVPGDLVPEDTNGGTDVFVHDLLTGETVRVSIDSTGNQAVGTSSDPAISPDGRYVAFRSSAANLVAGDTNGMSDIFLHGPIAWQTPPNPTVTIKAADRLASEPGTNKGKFKIIRTGDTSEPLVVRFKLSGSAVNGVDYKKLSRRVTIPAGAGSKLIRLVPLDDIEVEGKETVIARLAVKSSYTVGTPNTARIVIRDDD